MVALLPQHVAIIMDGNGRWAAQQGRPRLAGHQAGVVAVERVIQRAIHHQLKQLTLFALSHDNLSRPPQEVSWLFRLFSEKIEAYLQPLVDANIQLKVIGDTSVLPKSLQALLVKAAHLTEHGQALQLCLAINYSGRQHLLDGMKTMHQALLRGELTEAEITPSRCDTFFQVGGSAPDLLIRTSGEQRLSDFMLWPLAYTELYFSPVLWPDFQDEDFDAALDWFVARDRRYGQVKESSHA